MKEKRGGVDAPAMEERDFEQIRRSVYDFCGVDLKGKKVLVETRLSRRLRALKFSSFAMYTEQVCAAPDSDEFTAMIDSLTTNHTSFFRESQHFDLLRNTIIPSIAPNTKIRLWSAACSSGQEPYTIAFALMDALGRDRLSNVSILATDISTLVLEKARQGLYPMESLTGMDKELLRSCFLRGIGDMSGSCLVKPDLRSLIKFERFNLLDSCSSFGKFDVIFCRNVMIYFDLSTQQSLVSRLTAQLNPGGYLLIGHSESLNGITHSLEYVCPATYRLGAAGKSKPSQNRWSGSR
jgi:chemotaxis protein methyltransferase CheR